MQLRVEWVLFNPRVALQVASRRPEDDDTRDLWHSTRWLHVQIAYAERKTMLNLQVVYGVSGQPIVNAQLWGCSDVVHGTAGNCTAHDMCGFQL